jgi:predicted Zn-dependent peptidase
MKVLFVPNERSIAFAMSVFVVAGARRDPKGKEGLAHCVEHMALKRTRKFCGDNALSVALGTIGAQYNAYTTHEVTAFSIRSGILKTEECIKILGEVVRRPLFTEEDFQKERSVILDEVVQYENDTESVVVEALDRFFFAGHELANPTVGTKASLSNITLADVSAWHGMYYVPSNISIAVSCSVEKRMEVCSWIEKYFIHEEDGVTALSAPAFSPAVFEWSEKKDNHIVIPDKDDEGILRIAFPGIPYKHDRGVVMWVLANVFGGSECSVLVRRLQHQLGLTYSVLCFPYSYHDCGMFIIHTQASHDKIYDVYAETFSLIRGFERACTAEDIEIAKQITLSNLYLMMDSNSMKITNFYGLNALYGVELPLHSFICAISSVTAEEVYALARDIFSRQPAVAVMGPFEPVKTKRRLHSINKKATGGAS